jgi:type II secretory pathway component PulK
VTIDKITGAALIAALLILAVLAIAGAAYLDCQHANLAPLLSYCQLSTGAR